MAITATAFAGTNAPPRSNQSEGPTPRAIASVSSVIETRGPVSAAIARASASVAGKHGEMVGAGDRGELLPSSSFDDIIGAPLSKGSPGLRTGSPVEARPESRPRSAEDEGGVPRNEGSLDAQAERRLSGTHLHGRIRREFVRAPTEAGDALAALAVRWAQLDGVVDRVNADEQLVDEPSCDQDAASTADGWCAALAAA